MAILFDSLSSSPRVALPGPRALFARIVAWQARRARQARIMRELSTYADRDLADLGFTRADIPAVARGTYRR